MSVNQYLLYPLSSASGLPIPLDVIKPMGHKRYTANASAWLNPVQFTTQELEDILILLYSEANLTISFSSTGALSDIAAGDLWIPGDTVVQVEPQSQYISALANVETTIELNIIARFDTLATERQVDHV